MFNSIKKHLYPIVSVFTLLAVVAGLFTFVSPVYASIGTLATPPTVVDKYLMARIRSEQSWPPSRPIWTKPLVSLPTFRR